MAKNSSSPTCGASQAVAEAGHIVLRNVRIPYSLLQDKGQYGYSTAKDYMTVSDTTVKDPAGHDKVVKLFGRIQLSNPSKTPTAEASQLARYQAMLADALDLGGDAGFIERLKTKIAQLDPDSEPDAPVDPIVVALAEIGKLDATIEADVRQQIATLLEQAKALCAPQAAPASA